jgi:hypothetical protein
MGTSAICCPVVGLTTLSIGVVSAEIPMLFILLALGEKATVGSWRRAGPGGLD